MFASSIVWAKFCRGLSTGMLGSGSGLIWTTLAEHRFLLGLARRRGCLLKQGDYGKESDSEQQAEKNNLCSLVTERTKGG